MTLILAESNLSADLDKGARFDMAAETRRDGYPDPSSRTGRVWTVADQITQQQGRRATRGEVMDRIVAEGGNHNTAATQYQRWKAAQDAEVREERPVYAAPKTAEEPCIPPRWLKVTDDGRLLIPADMRSAMGIEDGVIHARVEHGELRLLSRPAAIKRVQRMVAPYRRHESEVDSFIAERRALWGED